VSAFVYKVPTLVGAIQHFLQVVAKLQAILDAVKGGGRWGTLEAFPHSLGSLLGALTQPAGRTWVNPALLEPVANLLL
jgi:hypothetical protein